MPDKWRRYINRFVNDIITKAASILVQPLLLIEISILLAWQETGAILVDIGELAVTQDLGIGVIDLEAAQQGYQGCLLRWGARVGRAPLFV